MNDDTDNETDLSPASPELRVQFLLFGEEGSLREVYLKIRESKLNEDQPGWGRRDVASVLLDRLGDELEEPETLSDFDKIMTFVEEEVAEGPVLDTRGGPGGSRAKSGACHERVLKRHEDGWMVRDPTSVDYKEANFEEPESER